MSNKRNKRQQQSAAKPQLPAQLARPLVALPNPTIQTPNPSSQAVLFSAQFNSQQGPLPSPDVLAYYERTMPGLADRIVKMAETETEHRRKVELEIVGAQKLDLRRFRQSEMLGTVSGLAIGIFSIAAAVYAGIHGAQVTGSVVGTTGVTGLVTAFISGRHILAKQQQQNIQASNDAAKVPDNAGASEARIVRQ